MKSHAGTNRPLPCITYKVDSFDRFKKGVRHLPGRWSGRKPMALRTTLQTRTTSGGKRSAQVFFTPFHAGSGECPPPFVQFILLTAPLDGK